MIFKEPDLSNMLQDLVHGAEKIRIDQLTYEEKVAEIKLRYGIDVNKVED